MNIFSPSYRSPDPVSGFDGPEEPEDPAFEYLHPTPVESYISWLRRVENLLRDRPTPHCPPQAIPGNAVMKTCHSKC